MYDDGLTKDFTGEFPYQGQVGLNSLNTSDFLIFRLPHFRQDPGLGCTVESSVEWVEVRTAVT